MNWSKIKTQSPKSYESFGKYYHDNEDDIFSHDDERLLIEDFDFNYLIGWLTVFFETHGIRIDTSILHSGKMIKRLMVFSKYDAEIFCTTSNGLESIDLEDIVGDRNFYKHSELMEVLFTYCFHLLEKDHDTLK